MIWSKYITALLITMALPLVCLGQGADARSENKAADREAARKEAIRQRIEANDKPLRSDPIGNAIVGGAAAGVVRGSVAAAATSGGRSAVVGTAAQAVKPKSKPLRPPKEKAADAELTKARKQMQEAKEQK